MIQKIGVVLFLLALTAASVLGQQVGGGGSSSVVVGSPFVGPSGCVAYSSGGTAVGCDADFTYGGSGGTVTMAGGALGASPGLLVNPASCTGVGVDTGAFVVRVGGVALFSVDCSGSVSVSGNFYQLAGSNNYVIVNSGRNAFQSPADGILEISNSGGSDMDRVQLGGRTSAFPAIQRLAAGIRVRLADDSANAIVTAAGATLTNLSTGTNADFLCLSAAGVVLIQTTACTISSLAHKPDWKLFEDDAIASIRRLEVGTFHFDDVLANQPDPNARSLQIGLNAENVAAIVPEAAVYEDDMQTPKSYRQESIIALLVKAMQQQQVEIDTLKKQMAR